MTSIGKFFDCIREYRKIIEIAGYSPEAVKDAQIRCKKTFDKIKARKEQHTTAVEKEILMLKKAGKDINLFDPKTETSLLWFIVTGFLDNRLLSYFDSSDLKQPIRLLAEAALRNNIEATVWLLKNGVSPHIENSDGDSILKIVVCKGYTGVVEALLENGADVDIKDEYGYTPLHFAILGNHPQIAQLLLDHGADTSLRDKDGNPPLDYAVYRDNLEVTRLLFEYGADANTLDKNGNSILCKVVWQENFKMVEIFTNNGANLNIKDSMGKTPLCWAAFKGNDMIVKLLLENGANLNMSNNNGFSPMEMAFLGLYNKSNRTTDENLLNIIKIFIEHKVEITGKEIDQAILADFQHEATKGYVLLLILSSSKNIKIDLAPYSVHQFFTDENNIKALFSVEGYESQKAIAKENIFRSLQEYGESHKDQKALDIAQLVSQQEIDLPRSETDEDTALPDQLDYEAQLCGDFEHDSADAA